MKRSPQQLAALRTCASCEWIHTGFAGCPKCGFAAYGARYAYGSAAYRHKRTQEPWLKKKMQAHEWTLLDEISQANVKDHSLIGAGAHRIQNQTQPPLSVESILLVRHA